MKITRGADLPKTGRIVLIYGEPGVGKTTAIFASALEPVWCAAFEPRNPRESIEVSGRPNADIDIAEYSDWYGFMDYLADFKNFERYNTLAFDSLSYLMNSLLAKEIEDESFEAREEKEKVYKVLINQAKMSQEGYGGLSSQMSRMMNLLGQYAKAGKTIILTALLAENPKWNRELAAAPALKGREFPLYLPGYCDLIGLVTPRVDADSNKVFPPLVQFESPDGSFMAKYTGKRPPKGKYPMGPLDFTKILRLDTQP